MKLIKGVLAGAVVVGVLGTASAHAALPEFSGTLPDGGNSSSGLPKFENKGSLLAVACVRSEGLVVPDTAKEAWFDELFLGCEAVLNNIKVGKCTGLTDGTTGSILLKGTLTLGFALGSLTPLVALTVTELHFECPLGTLVVVKGCLLGTTTLVKSLTGLLAFEGAAGMQRFVDYTNDKGSAVACKLESSVNGAAFGQVDLVQTMSVTFSNEIEVKD